MSTVALPTMRMTTEEMFALPENGTDRELIEGELRENPVTIRNRRHGRSTIRIGHLLEDWLENQPEPRGEIVGGEAGFRLKRNPDTTVGIDVAYVSAEVAAKTPGDARVFDGPPVLAVEILSPSDTHERVTEKVTLYREASVAEIWVVDPKLRTVLVLLAGQPPVLFNETQELTGGPELPGFRAAVAGFFRI